MPKLKIENGKEVYYCSICGRKHGGNILMAEACEKTHDIVYLKVKPGDVKRLMQYIFTTDGDKNLLTEELMNELTKVSRRL